MSMNSTKINARVQKSLKEVLFAHPLVGNIVKAIADAGGHSLLVGGAVRDLLLDLPIKDLDIEVHGLPIAELEKILQQFGPVSLVGKVFGVLRVHGLDADWSLPRIDTAGRKPKVSIDPFMDIKDAFRRRDLTINAMGIDLITFELIDPFNGHADLKQGVLCVPDERRFVEDPLRLFRVMQFIGRFEMKPDESLNSICKTMDIRGVSRERIEAEFEKLLLRSDRPSLGIRWLNQIGRLREILPELADTIGVEQDPEWHPEGDVFEHTMQTIDAAAVIEYEDPEQKLIILYAALCHDLGKVTTTEHIEGKIKSFGHEKVSERLARRMLLRITRQKELIKTVRKLVRYHMSPAALVVSEARLSRYKRLANKLAPETTMEILADLVLADKRGRNRISSEPLQIPVTEVDLFLKKAHEAQVERQPEAPVLLGRDLLDVVEPGPKMGELLRRAYQIQIEQEIKDKQELKRRVLQKNNNE